MNDFELFQGTTFSDLMKDVYHNSKKKSRQIDSLIQDLKPFIKNIGDATIVAPLLKDYLEVSVKNDDALVKLSAVVQRLVSTKTDDDGNEFGMSDEERARLLEEAEQEIKSIKKEHDKEVNGAIFHSGSRDKSNII
jgi:gas vesicle protein